MTDTLLDIMNKYTSYSLRADGMPEINSLRYASFESIADVIPKTARLALVLIEPRILTAVAGIGPDEELLSRLERFKGDLRAEGLCNRFIIADVYSGSVPKDGSTVIALRRFLQDVKKEFPNLEGVTFVGSFPEATLVRRWAWAPGFSVVVQGVQHPENEQYLSIAPELIATRSELVLSDLNGNWESLYHYPDITIQQIIAFPDVSTKTNGWTDGTRLRTCTFTSTDYEITQVKFNDCFYIDDAIYTSHDNGNVGPGRFLQVSLFDAQRNPEVDIADLSLANVIARPDISVSRINARNVARNPDPRLTGDDGLGFLDSNGNPRSFSSERVLFGDNQISMFNYVDARLERRMYNSYFDRNHRFRVGAFSNLPFRTSSISSGALDENGTIYSQFSSFSRYLNLASSDFAPGLDNSKATIPEYVKSLKQPAVLRYTIAHSSPWGSEFPLPYNTQDLEAELGGLPLRWVRKDKQYRPSMEGYGNMVDLFLHRALFHNKVLNNAGESLVIHGGCNVNSVFGTTSSAYSSTEYGGWQNAEGILFCTNTVAILSRAKEFYDSPDGFTDEFGRNSNANFGTCFGAFFNYLANNGAVASDFAGNKRAYHWSMNGDWTLRLRNRNGLGILGFSNGLKGIAVHPNNANIDWWRFNGAVNAVRGIGDIDGDGQDEILLTSDWGICIVKHNGNRWQQLFIAPRDTWFGGWRYDCTTSAGRDTIHAVRNLTGGAAKEILITSAWGVGVLALNNGTLTTTAIYANGTKLGNWTVDSSKDRIIGTGDFDGDGRHEVLVTNATGLGILSFHLSQSLFNSATGSRLGGWALNTNDNVIAQIADLDGDGRDEIVITSPWGIGVLKLVNGLLTSVAMHYNGEVLNGYTVNNSDRIVAADRFRGGLAAELLVMNSSGIHLIGLSAGKLTRVGGISNDTRVGGWLHRASVDRISYTGVFLSSPQRQFMISSPWGIGVLGFGQNGEPLCHALHQFDTTLGDWYLQSADAIVASGNLLGGGSTNELLIIKKTP